MRINGKGREFVLQQHTYLFSTADDEGMVLSNLNIAQTKYPS